MNDDLNIELLIKEGEGYLVEFKESVSHLEKEISAFANASGGTIYIGISDGGEIHTVNLTNKLKSELVNAARNCDPSPKIEIKKVDKIIALHVYESTDKPVRAPTGFYLRIDATSQKLTRDEILSFAVTEDKILFDKQLHTAETSDQCLNIRAIEFFREKARLDIDLDNKQLLENLECIKYQENKSYLTNAGFLLFGKNPQRVFPHSTLTILHMKNPANIIEQKIFKGTLFEEVETAFEYIVSLLKTKIEIKSLRREEILEIPEFVVRELVVNAIIHRDYFERAADIVIKIFPTFIEFSNPGIVSKKVPLDLLFGRSYRRNPMIADMFHRANYIERAGTGLLRVRQALESLNLPPLQISEEGIFFVVKLPREVNLFEKWKLNERQQLLLSMPSIFFPFSTQQYASKFDISERMARIDIQELVERDILKPFKKGRHIRYNKKT